MSEQYLEMDIIDFELVKKFREENKTFFQKSGEYLSGEWEEEEDYMEWVESSTNLECIVIRGPLGALNGYVELPETIWKKKQEKFKKDRLTSSDFEDFHIHGGITYAGKIKGKEHYYIGFDTGHAFDFLPYMGSPSLLDIGIIDTTGITYKNMDYVRGECEALAAQIKFYEEGDEEFK